MMDRNDFEKLVDLVVASCGRLIEHEAEKLRTEFREEIQQTAERIIETGSHAMGERIDEIQKRFDDSIGELGSAVRSELSETTRDHKDSFENILKSIVFVEKRCDTLTGAVESNSERILAIDQTFNDWSKVNDDIKRLGSEIKRAEAGFVELSHTLEVKQSESKVQFDEFDTNLRLYVDTTLDRMSDQLIEHQSETTEKFDAVFHEVNDVRDGVTNTVSVMGSKIVDKDLPEMLSGFTNQLSQFKHQIESDLKVNDANARTWLAEMINEVRSGTIPAGMMYWHEGLSVQAGSVVRHRGGIWHCISDTKDEPTRDSKAWVCGTVGIAKVWLDDCRAESATIVVQDSLGKAYELDLPLPNIRYIHGTWDKTRQYRRLDSIMLDGVRWIALCDDPAGKPGDSKDWVLQAMRGPKGPKGIQGPVGDQGPQGEPGRPGADVDINEVARQVVEAFKHDVTGPRIDRWRGEWANGQTYMPGDLVKYREFLYLAVGKIEGGSGPDQMSDDWLSLGVSAN